QYIGDTSVAELKTFIALLYIRGIYGGKSIHLESFWSEKYGVNFFPQAMARNHFREIMGYLRFDDKGTRGTRMETDKFAMTSEVWNAFVQNCIACYKPGENITVDEQLYPTKARCHFTHYRKYLSSKPDKFGIKLWLAVDVETKYMVNGFPFLGKDESQQSGEQWSENVVLKLVEPYLNKGRNVTTDNFFTSLSLANQLVAKNTSLVGTMNRARWELPPSAKDQGPAELYCAKVMRSNRATLSLQV
ncbi:hypothetical protein AAFF_G00223930, partial [Aldrovandia affinis]